VILMLVAGPGKSRLDGAWQDLALRSKARNFSTGLHSEQKLAARRGLAWLG
jgi:hypothetical protein